MTPATSHIIKEKDKEITEPSIDWSIEYQDHMNSVYKKDGLSK